MNYKTKKILRGVEEFDKCEIDIRGKGNAVRRLEKGLKVTPRKLEEMYQRVLFLQEQTRTVLAKDICEFCESGNAPEILARYIDWQMEPKISRELETEHIIQILRQAVENYKAYDEVFLMRFLRKIPYHFRFFTKESLASALEKAVENHSELLPEQSEEYPWQRIISKDEVLAFFKDPVTPKILMRKLHWAYEPFGQSRLERVKNLLSTFTLNIEGYWKKASETSSENFDEDCIYILGKNNCQVARDCFEKDRFSEDLAAAHKEWYLTNQVQGF